MREIDPTGQSMELTSLLRRQLHEMMAASQALGPALAENKNGRECLAVLNRGMFRQMRLIHQLELDCRLNSPDEIRLDLRPTDLVEVCRSVADRVGGLVRELGIQVEFSTSLTALATMADRGALEDMLLALISNCVNAVRETGRSDGSIRVELERQDRKAVLTLTDNGGGMDPGTLAGLFDAPAEEDAPPESGAIQPAHGLSLAQQIAALHGGIMIVDSQEHRGVRLAISLPLLEGTGGVLHSPGLRMDESGGWDKALTALSDCLPVQAFLPEVLGR